MAVAPFDPNQLLPGDNDIVSQHPVGARAFRDIMESWMLINHDRNGNHDRLALIDKTAAVPAGVAAILTIWQEAGILKWRYGTDAVQVAFAEMAANTLKGRLTSLGPPQDLTGTQAVTILDAVTADTGAGGLKGLVPAPPTGSSAARKVLGANATFVHTGAPHAAIGDYKSPGVQGGTFTAGAWRTRDLTQEIIDPAGLVTIAANAFTLQAGTYVIMWSAPAHNVNGHQSRLYNVTDAVAAQVGSSEFSGNGGSTSVQTRSEGIAEVVIASAKAFQIQHYCGATQATNGFGVALGQTAEGYTMVKIWKVG